MTLSRREFVHALGVGGSALASAFIAARGQEALAAEPWQASPKAPLLPPGPGEIRLSGNENPLGPGKTAIDALVGEFGQAGRYPFNSRLADSDLVAALAGKYGVKPENIVLGAGSREILRNGVRAFTSPERPLITGSPSYEVPPTMAELIGTPVKKIALDGALKLDLEAMAEAARGAGLVFVCNPNNPSATVHSAKELALFVDRVHRASPDTAILIDEAYHDYVTDSTHATAVPLAMEHPKVFVTRTFSKAYGMAGLRLGYAIGQPETIKTLTRYKLTYNANVLAIAPAIASLGDPAHIARERQRNTEVRKFTLDFLASGGYKATESQTNFVFVDLGRPAKEFREACEKQRVMVGRDFPPLEKSHSRISIGTMEEMRQATEVFRNVLGLVETTSAARGRG